MSISFPYYNILSFQYFTAKVSANYSVTWMGCKIKSNCPLVGPGAVGGMPFVGVFLRDPSPYL